jgi:hypothetical protein
MSVMSKGNPQVQQDRSPLFYNHRAREVLNTNDERPIDVDVCPLCTNVRLVFDCTKDDCRYVRCDPLSDLFVTCRSTLFDLLSLFWLFICPADIRFIFDLWWSQESVLIAIAPPFTLSCGCGRGSWLGHVFFFWIAF